MVKVDDEPLGLDPRETPTYWFVLMEAAKRDGDFRKAAEAKEQLERLGVAISFHPPVRVRQPQEG